jgi:hypothetical protein
MMTTSIRAALAMVALAGTLTLAAQPAAPIDTTRLGPQVGQTVPPLDGVDQFGRRQTLTSVYGPKGAMLVFFRSADW